MKQLKISNLKGTEQQEEPMGYKEFKELIGDTIKDWLFENYDAHHIEHIAQGELYEGIEGLSELHETIKFYDKFTVEIWDLLYKESQDEGLSIMEFIADLNGGKSIGSDEQFKNLLAWYAAERVAQRIVEGNERH